MFNKWQMWNGEVCAWFHANYHLRKKLTENAPRLSDFIFIVHFYIASDIYEISNYTFDKVYDEISYPCLNFNGATIKVWECISNFMSHTGHVGSKLIPVSKRDPGTCVSGRL